MKQIDIICNDKIYTEMLCLELEALGYITSGRNTGRADVVVCEAGQNIAENCITFSRTEGNADLTRPFLVKELVELIEKASGGALDKPQKELHVSPVSNHAVYKGERVELSELEHKILYYLYLRRDKYVSQSELASEFFGKESSVNPVRVYISYLRNKFDEAFGVKLIYTVRGKGYMLKTK